MKDLKQIVKEPIFFERNRVYRIYKGGMPYKELFNDGYDDGSDNNFKLRYRKAFDIGNRCYR